MSVIQIEDLTVSYGDQPVLWDIDLNIEENSLTAIVGPNGAGKSTLMKSILGFLSPISGRITLFGQPLSKVRDRISYVPQQNSVHWDFPISVFEVVLMGRYRGWRWLSRFKKEDYQKATLALQEMNLLDLKDRQISELSGGQKQRVFIARALCQDGDILFMDEPFAGVDQVSEKIIVQKMKSLKKEGKTVVCVHHDLNTVEDYFDHLVLIHKRIIQAGKLEDVFKKEFIEETYGEGHHG